MTILLRKGIESGLTHSSDSLGDPVKQQFSTLLGKNIDQSPFLTPFQQGKVTIYISK